MNFRMKPKILGSVYHGGDSPSESDKLIVLGGVFWVITNTDKKSDHCLEVLSTEGLRVEIGEL
jgi:hypothetical protein